MRQVRVLGDKVPDVPEAVRLRDAGVFFVSDGGGAVRPMTVVERGGERAVEPNANRHDMGRRCSRCRRRRSRWKGIRVRFEYNYHYYYYRSSNVLVECRLAWTLRVFGRVFCIVRLSKRAVSTQENRNSNNNNGYSNNNRTVFKMKQDTGGIGGRKRLYCTGNGCVSSESVSVRVLVLVLECARCVVMKTVRI